MPKDLKSSIGDTTAAALARPDQVRGFLTSFRRLTDQVRPRMDETVLKAIGNTDRSRQSLGCHNLPLTIEATLLKQD